VFFYWLIYVLWQHPLVTVACIGIFTSLFWFHRRSNGKHLQTLAANRAGESICSFARAEHCRNLDTWVVRAVYEEIQGHLASGCSGFPLRWTDRLKEDLRIDPDALDEELAIDIAERTGRELKNTESNPLFGKVETVRDLVLFFQGQPKPLEEPNKLLQATRETRAPEQ
jgi:hypothetical protein